MSNGPYNWNGTGGQVSYPPMSTTGGNQGMFGTVQVPATMMGNQNQQTQPVKPSYIPGRMIGNLNEITPQEVPMDGSAAIFPSSDLSCIYLKAWGSDGLIKTFKFVPDAESSSENSPGGNFEKTVMERFDKIEETLNKRLKPYYNRNRNNQNGSKKEEVNPDER